MPTINGKAIYSPSGKASEYAKYGCNFYVGCSNGCEYCYLHKGRGSAILGSDKPTLKKCFRDEKHALEVFEKELIQNKAELQEHGLFFSFTTDPMLPETYFLTIHAMGICLNNFIPVKILTKCTDWTEDFLDRLKLPQDYKLIAFGFTLTNHDELEPNASSNIQRVSAMAMLHAAGFKTFASIEPVINFADSLVMINQANPHCDYFKIGLLSGDKHNFSMIRAFILHVLCKTNKPVYFKDSLLRQAKMERKDLPQNCVTRHFNIFQ